MTKNVSSLSTKIRLLLATMSKNVNTLGPTFLLSPLLLPICEHDHRIIYDEECFITQHQN